MKTVNIPKGGFINNIDTANEEIARLDVKLGNPKREFEENIDVANALVAELEVAIKLKAIASAPKPVAQVPTPKVVTAPTLTGLQRAIVANSKQPIKPAAVGESKVTGLQRAINANILKSKSK